MGSRSSSDGGFECYKIIGIGVSAEHSQEGPEGVSSSPLQRAASTAELEVKGQTVVTDRTGGEEGRDVASVAPTPCCPHNQEIRHLRVKFICLTWQVRAVLSFHQGSGVESLHVGGPPSLVICCCRALVLAFCVVDGVGTR